MHRCYMNNCILWFSVFLLVVYFDWNEAAECGKRSLNPGQRCPESYFESENEPCIMRDVELEVTDASKGEVGLQFRVSSRSCKTYRFELSVNDTLHELKCVNESRKYINKEHSSLQLNMDNHKLGTCKEILHNVTFNAVYQGCYKLYFCSLNVGTANSRSCQQLVKYLNTSFVPMPVEEYVEPKLTPEVHNDSHMVAIIITNYTRLEHVQLDIDPDSSEHCNKTEANKVTIFVKRSADRSLLCSKSKPCNQDSRDLKCSPIDCEETNSTEIRCRFYNVPPGNYCVHMFIKLPVCELENCHLYQKFVVSAAPLTYNGVSDPSISDEYVILMVGVCFLLITFFIVIVVIFRRRWNSPGRVIIPKEDQNLLQWPEILLLYPYDCKAFMDTMTRFREILEEKTGCKVYDCFDPHHAEDLSANKIDWMRRHISRRSMKILVIENAAAAVHQRALLQSSKVVYRDPNWLDGLFLYALKALTDDVDSNNYQRIFVVRIEGFTAERDSLNHLTPYTRYVVPQHLDMLVSNLCVRSSRRSTLNINIEGEGSRSLQRFQQDIQNLLSFRQQNPDYLLQMLYTSECVMR